MHPIQLFKVEEGKVETNRSNRKWNAECVHIALVRYCRAVNGLHTHLLSTAPRWGSSNSTIHISPLSSGSWVHKAGRRGRRLLPGSFLLAYYACQHHPSVGLLAWWPELLNLRLHLLAALLEPASWRFLSLHPRLSSRSQALDLSSRLPLQAAGFWEPHPPLLSLISGPRGSSCFLQLLLTMVTPVFLLNFFSPPTSI